MDAQGQVWSITRVDDKLAYARAYCLIPEDRPGERAFTHHHVRQWPVVQIQPLPNDPPDPPLLPCPFCGARAQQVPFTSSKSVRCCRCGANIHAKTEDVVVQRWNTRAEVKPIVRWEYHPNARMLVARVDGDGFGCHLAPSTAEDDPYKAINLLTQQLNARTL